MTGVELDTIHCIDALTLLRSLPDNFVECVVTSPPYNLRNTTGEGLYSGRKCAKWTFGGYGQYADSMPHDDYVKWQREIVRELVRVLSPTGAIFYNHKWRVQGGLYQRLGDEIVDGFPLRQIVIWDRGSGFNFNHKFFTPTYEVIYVIAGADYDIQHAYPDVWRINFETNKQHPNSFPQELAERCINACKDGIVYDPFMGAGTTALVAQKLGRRYLGSELNAEYVDLANHRLQNRMGEYQAKQADEPHTVFMFDVKNFPRG